MAFKEVQRGNTIDIKKEPNKPYTGIYKGKKTIHTEIGEQFIYQFVDDDGMPYGLYGFTTLNISMEGVGIGKLTRVTYLGTKKVKTKFGMKDVHQCRVETDDDYAEEVSEGDEAVAY